MDELYMYHFYLLNKTLICKPHFWNIWKARNKYHFDNEAENSNTTASKSINNAKEIFNAFKGGLERNNKKNYPLINWSFLPTGCIKINMDSNSVDHG